MVFGEAKVEEDTIYEEIITKLSVTDEKEEKENNLCIYSVGSLKKKKKLIVLDLNGLLADIVFPPPRHVKADAIIAKKACE